MTNINIQKLDFLKNLTIYLSSLHKKNIVQTSLRSFIAVCKNNLILRLSIKRLNVFFNANDDNNNNRGGRDAIVLSCL